MNRLWAMFFGTALSAAVDDLGSQGELPTHPDLLDWLACEFRDSGWDFKHMIRLIVSSRHLPAVERRSSRRRWRSIRPTGCSPRKIPGGWRRSLSATTPWRSPGLLNLADIGGPSVKPYQPAGYYAVAAVSQPELRGRCRRAAVAAGRLHPLAADVSSIRCWPTSTPRPATSAPLPGW